MELYVYRFPKELSDERYAAVLVDFKSLEDKVEASDDGFYVNAKTIPELLRKIVRYLKAEIYTQLHVKYKPNGKETEKDRVRKEAL